MKKTIITLALIAMSAIGLQAQKNNDSINLTSQIGVSIDYSFSPQFGTINFSTFSKGEGQKGLYANIGYTPFSSSLNANIGAAIPYSTKSHKFIDVGINVNTDFISKTSNENKRYSSYLAEIGLRWQHMERKGWFFRTTLGLGYRDWGYSLNDVDKKYQASGLAVVSTFTLGYMFKYTQQKVKNINKK